MRRLLLAAALLAAGGASASNGLVAQVNACPEARRGCSDTLAFAVDRTVEQAGNTAIFVGFIALTGGDPNLGIAAWYDGGSWTPGSPKPMSTGRHRANQVQRISLPAGACDLALNAGAPAGMYGLYIGWGAFQRGGQDELDVSEVQRAIASADPETAATLTGLLRDYAEANVRLGKHDATGASAFTDMRHRKSFQNVRTYNCGGNA